MTALVALTGATGFLGGHIADALLARGCRLRASVRATSDQRWIRDKGLETIEAVLAPPSGAPDEAGLETLDALLDGAERVIHCAGVVRARDEAGYRRANTLSTRRLLEAAARAGSVRAFVLISSLAASGPSAPGRPRREDDPCAPITAYGRSKVEAESLLERDWPFRTAALRPPALYGPRDRAFLPLFKAAGRGLGARIGRVKELSLVDGRDAARAAVLLAEDERARGAYFVEDGMPHAIADLTAALSRGFGRPILTLPLPVGLLRLFARLVGGTRAQALPLLAEDRLVDVSVDGWACTGEKIRRELGFSDARDLDTGFAETLDFYRREGWL
ncbi:NAD-dependent epimerase/dehydratase family protein [bacterium]|nr:NAD-dependent epimerase/dehydratase family protein [bacterium]MBU1072919.1 NAD-dependent epimerase/dehydratase family protein [bacterium]MBU1674791.1 NAD-dependent epimerase/dehydratase family protein [bacterium]